MRSVPLLLVLAACGSREALVNPALSDDGSPSEPDSGFLSRGSLGGDVLGVSLYGDGGHGVVSMDGMTCAFSSNTGTTSSDEDVLPDEGGEVVVDSAAQRQYAVALLLAGDRIVLAESDPFGWDHVETGVHDVIAARLLPDGFVALRILEEGCAVDFWRMGETGLAEAYGGAWVDACDAGTLAADPETGRAWAVVDGKIVEVTAEGAVALDIPAQRVAWDAGADALYTADGDVLGAWEADGAPRWSVSGVDVRSLVAMPELGLVVARVAEGAESKLIAYDGLTGAALYEARTTRADGPLVAAGRFVAVLDGPHRVSTWEVR